MRLVRIVLGVLLVTKGLQAGIVELPPQNPHFVGRVQEVGQIKEALLRKPTFVITGGPGFGKTQLAMRYAYQTLKNYDVIWWIQAEQDLSAQLKRLIQKLNKILPEGERLLFKGMASSKMMADLQRVFQKRKTLIIVDNAQDLEPFKPLGECAHILVTTRRVPQPYASFTLEGLKQEDALALLQNLDVMGEKALLHTLAQNCNNHPLALVTASHFLKTHPTITLEAYTAQTAKTILADSQDQAQNINTLLALTLKDLTETHPDAARLLKFLTFLHPKGIPFSFVVPFLHKIGSFQSPHNVVSVLYQRSLVAVHQNPEVRLVMHDLIHKLLGEQVPQEEAPAFIKQALALIAPTFEGRSDLVCERIVAHPEYLMHAQKLCERAKEYDTQSKELLILKIRMFDVLLCELRELGKSKKNL